QAPDARPRAHARDPGQKRLVGAPPAPGVVDQALGEPVSGPGLVLVEAHRGGERAVDRAGRAPGRLAAERDHVVGGLAKPGRELGQPLDADTDNAVPPFAVRRASTVRFVTWSRPLGRPDR